MKILLVNNRHFIYGGVDRYFFNLSELLRSMGQQTIPFCVENAKNLKSPYSGFFLGGIDFPAGALRPARILKTAVRILHSPQAQRRLRALIRDVRPDIAHIHNIYHNISPSILGVLKKHKIPIVQTLHDFERVCPVCILYAGGRICQRCRGGRFYHAAFKRCKDNKLSASAMCSVKSYFHNFTKAYSRVDVFVSPSRFAQEKLEYCGFKPQKMVRVPHFAVLEKAGPAAECGGYVLYFGRLHESKGLFTLVGAAGKIPGLRLKIAGEGPIRNQLEALIKRQGLDNISLEGYKQDEGLRSLIAGCSFTVFPSESYEVFGLSIIESFAMGRPVIASRLGAAPEIIDDGINGLLFEPGDENDLRHKMQTLLERRGLAEQMGRNARENAEAEYSPRRHYEKLMKIYTELAGGSESHTAKGKMCNVET